MSNTETTRRRPWLIMLYLAGDNNLTEEMVLSLQDLREEGPPAGDKVVAQFDPSGLGLETQRYVFDERKGLPLEKYRDETFAGLEINTGSPEALAEFITWAMRQDLNGEMSWLLVLSGHGGGTTDDFLLKDENSLDALSMSELKEALSTARARLKNPAKKIDILGMDACFMSMGEVAFEIRDSVDILVGAEGLEPAFGWPYRRLLAAGKGRQYRLTPEELAKEIVVEYVKHYSDYDRTAGRSADLSAMDLRNLGPVVDEFTNLATELKKLDKSGHERFLLAHWYAQTYKFDQFVDLEDLCAQTQKQFEGSKVYARCQAVNDALSQCVIKSGCSGFAYQHSYGLSIYFPWAFVSPDYQQLEFARQTGWAAFLETHVAATQRESRFGVQPHLATLLSKDDIENKRKARKEKFDRLRDAARKSLAEQRSAADHSGYSERIEAVSQVARSEVDRALDDQAIEAQFRALLRAPAVEKGVVDDRLNRAIDTVATTDVPEHDVPLEITRRFLRGSTFGDHNSRYTGGGSRYTGGGSKYTGGGSKYTGGGSRSPADREKSVKNLPPVIGYTLEKPVENLPPVTGNTLGV